MLVDTNLHVASAVNYQLTSFVVMATQRKHQSHYERYYMLRPPRHRGVRASVRLSVCLSVTWACDVYYGCDSYRTLTRMIQVKLSGERVYR